MRAIVEVQAQLNALEKKHGDEPVRNKTLQGVLRELIEVLQLVSDADKSQPHNPEGLTDARVGTGKGFRLLNKNEVPGEGAWLPTLLEIQRWFNGKWSKTGWRGDYLPFTYRTKLSVEELKTLRDKKNGT